MAQTTVSLRRLVTTAALLNGILANGNINRALVDMPAWRQTGVLAWAEFSRHADLGRNARILYPLEAFGGMVLSVAAVMVYRPLKSLVPWAAFPIYSAAALTVGGLLATIQAAPQMLSVRHLGNDVPALQGAFDRFELWGGVRGVCQVFAYVADLWSLATLCKGASHRQVYR